jgi:hypothetical protein
LISRFASSVEDNESSLQRKPTGAPKKKAVAEHEEAAEDEVPTEDEDEGDENHVKYVLYLSVTALHWMKVLCIDRGPCDVVHPQAHGQARQDPQRLWRGTR